MDISRLEAFRLLGIPAGSDQEAVAHAYRRLARETHPDVSADPEAAARFASLSAAYRLVSEPPAPAPDPATEPARHPRASAGSQADPVDHWPNPHLAAVNQPPVFLWPGARPRPWRRPPIIAGPVVVTPSTLSPLRSADRQEDV